MDHDPERSATVILGGGLAGISAAMHSTAPWLLFEREAVLGGLARTEQRDGFFFDRTGHWLHLRDPAMQTLARELMGDELVEVQRRARIYSHGVLTRYPFQGNLHGLPPRVVHECLSGAVEAHYRARESDGPAPRNFEQYLLHHFGDGIAQHFMLPYNAKLWGVDPCEITSAWCERFVPTPDLQQVIAGAVGAGPPELGYNIRFLYPRQGGIETFTRALAARIDPDRVALRARVESIDPATRSLVVDGQRFGYETLISTIPLPQLVELIAQAPDELTRAARRLRATPVRYLNVATRRPPPADYHWVYVPELRLPFYRVGIYSNVMPSMAPPGCASIYVELAARGPIGDVEALKAEVLHALVEVQAVGSSADVLFADLREIDPAYVIFDEAYEASLAAIHAYLEQRGILSVGRYGEWIYNAMEDSLLAGKRAAERAPQPAAGGDGR
jgi:protoporphyrinogen oxidase